LATGQNTGTPGALSSDNYMSRIATKRLDVSINPTEGFNLIEDPGVTRDIIRIEAKESFKAKENNL